VGLRRDFQPHFHSDMAAATGRIVVVVGSPWVEEQDRIVQTLDLAERTLWAVLATATVDTAAVVVVD